MNRVVMLLTLGVMLCLLAVIAVFRVAAQHECCEGGIINEGNLGGDVDTMNPILSSDTASSRVIGLMQLGFLGVDVDEAVIAPNSPGGIVSDWEVSDDGLVYTFSLRDDLAWSDGTP